MGILATGKKSTVGPPEATPWLVVRHVVVNEQPYEEVRTVAMADTETGDHRYLLVQCSLHEPDEGDRELGMDTYCLLDEKGAVHYGGVRSAVLRGTVLELGFDEKAVAELELPAPIVSLRLEVPEEQVRTLARGLREVLTYGSDRYRPEPLELERA